jgi:group I intron endonuclease
LKYGLENFSLAILEYCSVELLGDTEQFWINLLKPDYNNLKFVKSSRGYEHNYESLEKMKGVRPQFKPSQEFRAKLCLLARQSRRIYNNAFRDAISKRERFYCLCFRYKGKIYNCLF